MGKWIFSMIACLLFAALYTLCWSETTEAAQKTTIGVDTLNVHEAPGKAEPQIGHVQRGQTFTVLNEQYGWIKISLGQNKAGWVAKQFTVDQKDTTTKKTDASAAPDKDAIVTILHNSTYLRSGPGRDYGIVAQGNKNEHYTFIQQTGDWIQVKLSNGNKAYVAGWLVTTSKPTKTHNSHHESHNLPDKTIVIDPGHGGKDSGARGNHERLLEKNLTLKTAQQLKAALLETGAKVILTRDDDTFISLDGRVRQAKLYKADAFISLHYNASVYTNAKGIASFYYTTPKDQPLATAIQNSLSEQLNRHNRGVSYANYHVLRENPRPATLLELGYLTNDKEEDVIQTTEYQRKISKAIVHGLKHYFEDKS